MRPQYQTIQGQGGAVTGDCFRCCIASMLDMPALDVPHFYTGGKPGEPLPDDMRFAMQLWMEQRGMYYVEIAFRLPWATLQTMLRENYPHLTYLIMGINREGFVHAVLGRNGMVIHDPATSMIEKLGKPFVMGPLRDGHYRVGIIAKNL